MKNLEIKQDIFNEEALVHNNYLPHNEETKPNFQVFFKNKCKIESSKYPFLSKKQIEQRVTDEWKKKYGSHSNKLKRTKAFANRPENFEKCDSFHSDISWTSPPTKSYLVPLDVDFIPVVRKGALHRSCDKSGQKRRVSFNKDLYIRYRTTSEESSNSTLKDRKGNTQNDYHSTSSMINSPQTYKSISYHKSYIHPKTGKSTMEKKFDKLLNEKCTWSYKAQRNQITDEDSTMHLESTVMTIEISENKLNKEQKKNTKSMENKKYRADKPAKSYATKNCRKKLTRNVKNKVSPPKKFNNREKTKLKKTMLENSEERLSSQIVFSNSDRVMCKKRSLKPRDEITVLSSSSDEEVLQARNPAHDKVIYKENESDSCNMSDRETVSDEKEDIESGDITKKIFPIIIQATPYIYKDNADSTSQNSESKRSVANDKRFESHLENIEFLPQISKEVESVSADSLSVEPNTPGSERQNFKTVVKTNNYDESNENVKGKVSFDDNCNKKHSLKYLPKVIVNDSTVQNLEELETPPDENMVSDFLDGSFDICTYKVKERYFNYDPIENSNLNSIETNLNSIGLKENNQYENEAVSPELFTDNFYEMNIFKERELNYSKGKSIKCKKSEQVENSSIFNNMLPKQKRKIRKKRQTKKVNKKRKVQSSQNDSEPKEKFKKKTNRMNKMKNAPKETFIECINLDSTGDESAAYKCTRNSSLLASRRIREIGKIESISIINDSDIYSVHDEELSTSLSNSLKKNLDKITKEYLKNDNMLNENMDVLEHNRKIKKNSSTDQVKNKNARHKNKFQSNKFEEGDNYLRKNENMISRNKEPTSNLYVTSDQYNSSKNQNYVKWSKNKFQNNANLKTDNGKHLRKSTDKNDKNENLVNSYITNDEENCSSWRQKYSGKDKEIFQENKTEADTSEYFLRKYKKKKSNFLDDEKPMNQKYRTRSENQKKFKAGNDDYHFKENKDKNIKNMNIMSHEEDYSVKGFQENSQLETGKKKSKAEQRNRKETKNEAMRKICMLNKDSSKDKFKNVRKGKRKTWDDLENELFKDLDSEMTPKNARNVSKTIIVRQEKLVKKKDISNNTKLLTVSNRSMTQRISRSLKDGSYMQYEVKNTQSQYLESMATDTNPIGKEIIPGQSESKIVLQKAIAAMEKCSSEFMKQKVTANKRWMINNLMLEAKSDSLSNDIEFTNNLLLEENEPCTSNKKAPYRKNLRSSNKQVNYKNKTQKGSNHHALSKKDVKMFNDEHSVNISHKYSSVSNAEKKKQNAENLPLTHFQEVNPWDAFIKKLDLEENFKNETSMLNKGAKSERKEICEVVFNSYNESITGTPTNIINEAANIKKEIFKDENKLSNLESLNHSALEDDTSVKNDMLTQVINTGISETEIEKVTSITNEDKNILTPSKGKTVFFKGKISPLLKFKVKKDGSLKLKTHSSKGSSVTSSSEYSTKLKAAQNDIRIKQNLSNKTNKSREKYTKYLKKLCKMDSVVVRDQTVTPHVEDTEQSIVTLEKNGYSTEDDIKNELQKSKLIAQKDDDVFSVSSSESDDSGKVTSCGSGLLCDFFEA